MISEKGSNGIELIVYDHSMAVRDLSSHVKPDDIINTEHLITLLVVVSKYSQKDWLASYETLSNFVVCSWLFRFAAVVKFVTFD